MKDYNADIELKRLIAATKLYPITASIRLTNLTASIRLTNLTASIRLANLTASVKQDFFILKYFRYLADTTTLSDVALFYVSKVLADTLDMTDANHIAVYKTFEDIAPLSDAAAYAVRKQVADTALVNDTLALSTHFNRRLTDVLTLSDTAHIYERPWIESRTADSAVIGDTYSTALGKSVSDTALVSIDDTLELTTHFNRNFADSVGTSDVVNILFFSLNIPIFNRVTFNSSTFG